MFSPFRALGRLIVYIGWTLLLMPIQALALLLNLPLARRLPRIYHRNCCRIMALELVVQGRQETGPSTLFVANHTSYLDISVLGAAVAGSFVAKAEVSDWPLFGWLAKLQRTVFVDRRVSATATQRDEIGSRLDAGDSLILFPEGTSGDGNRILPFKSALFSVAQIEVEGRPITVQPVSVAYTKLEGLPMGRALRPFFAWYGDMEMGGHVWRMLGLGGFTVVVTFHEPVTIAEFGSRKELATHCRTAIAAGLAAALSGRALPAPHPAASAPA